MVLSKTRNENQQPLAAKFCIAPLVLRPGIDKRTKIRRELYDDSLLKYLVLSDWRLVSDILVAGTRTDRHTKFWHMLLLTTTGI